MTRNPPKLVVVGHGHRAGCRGGVARAGFRAHCRPRGRRFRCPRL